MINLPAAAVFSRTFRCLESQTLAPSTSNTDFCSLIKSSLASSKTLFKEEVARQVAEVLEVLVPRYKGMIPLVDLYCYLNKTFGSGKRLE